MLIFQYFLIIFIKMVESGICDDQVDQAGIHGATHIPGFSNFLQIILNGVT